MTIHFMPLFMKKYTKKTIVLGIFILSSFLFTSFSFLQIATPVLAQTTKEIERSRLEAELAQLEKDIAEKQALLDNQKKNSGTIQKDVNILTTQIENAKLKIKAKQTTIKKLTGEITDKSITINVLSQKLFREKESLGQLIRKTNEIDDKNIIHILLGSNTVSEVYKDLDSFASIEESIKESLIEVQGTKKITETEKSNLEKKQDQEQDAKVALESQKKVVEKSETEKKQLLSISKQKEQAYQTILKERAAKRAQILAALFSLRDTAAIPFGDALKYANFASQKTGVRPAFILAILKQESAWGKDQGSCYLTDVNTGAGVGKNSGKSINNVMKPTRDVVPFIEITKALGRDPFKTLVSCPIGGYGYGGAMGPAQFIPSTWKIMQNKIANALGGGSPDPWNAKDAFMASALYLDDLGAGAGGYTAERKAACRYYGGGSICTSKTSPYGDQVMAKAKNIQEDMIDPLSNI